jgi:hypothetical protein
VEPPVLIAGLLPPGSRAFEPVPKGLLGMADHIQGGAVEAPLWVVDVLALCSVQEAGTCSPPPGP